MIGRTKKASPAQATEGIVLPTIGKIKVGVKNEAGIPRSLDYFIASGKYKSRFDQVYFDKPNKIEIFFLSDNLREVCNERFELRGKDGRLYGKGDGDEFYIWNEKKGDYIKYYTSKNLQFIKDLKKRCESPNGWQRVLTLRFIIQKIKGVFGVWQFETKGKNSSIPQIIKAFDGILENLGTIRMIPFDLIVDKVKSQKPGQVRIFPSVKLIPNISAGNVDQVREFLESGGQVAKIPQLLKGDAFERQEEVKQIEENLPAVFNYEI